MGLVVVAAHCQSSIAAVEADKGARALQPQPRPPLCASLGTLNDDLRRVDTHLFHSSSKPPLNETKAHRQVYND